MWRDAPWHDSMDGRWSNVWRLFKQALGCTLFGHQIYESWDKFPGSETYFKTCDRCYRKWDWEGAPPSWLAEIWALQEAAGLGYEEHPWPTDGRLIEVLPDGQHENGALRYRPVCKLVGCGKTVDQHPVTAV